MPEFSEQDIARLRQLWDEGIASGSAGELDFQALRREAHRQSAAAAASPQADDDQAFIESLSDGWDAEGGDRPAQRTGRPRPSRRGPSGRSSG